MPESDDCSSNTIVISEDLIRKLENEFGAGAKVFIDKLTGEVARDDLVSALRLIKTMIVPQDLEFLIKCAELKDHYSIISYCKRYNRRMALFSRLRNHLVCF